MTSIFAVTTAVMLQMILGISIFVEQSPDMCSTAPNLASCIFLFAFLDILSDIDLYPLRYMHLPYVFQLLAETLMAVLATEFATLIVWCGIERICWKLCKFLLLLAGVPPNFYYNWERYILGGATTSISLTLFVCVGHATDHFHLLRKKSIRAYRKIAHHMSQILIKCRQLLRKEETAGKCESFPVYKLNHTEDDSRKAACGQTYNSATHSKRRRSRSRNSR